MTRTKQGCSNLLRESTLLVAPTSAIVHVLLAHPQATFYSPINSANRYPSGRHRASRSEL